jgi:ERCC4-type nuclease
MKIHKFSPSIEIPDGFTLVVDTREQTPLFLTSKPWIIYKKLDQGDYSVLGFEDRIAIERKSISDLLSVIGKNRERFEREIARLKDYWWKGLLIEGTEKDIYDIHRFSSVHPNARYHSLASFEIRGLHIYYAEDRRKARWWMLSRLVKLYNHLRESKDIEGVSPLNNEQWTKPQKED